MSGRTGAQGAFRGDVGERLTHGPVPIAFETMARCTLLVSDPGYERNIHTDVEIANRFGWDQPIAEGRLSAAMVSALVGSAVGPTWLTTGRLNLAFIKPVKPGDAITAHAIVTATRTEPAGRRLEFEVWCVNQRDEKITVGTGSCLV